MTELRSVLEAAKQAGVKEQAVKGTLRERMVVPFRAKAEAVKEAAKATFQSVRELPAKVGQTVDTAEAYARGVSNPDVQAEIRRYVQEKTIQAKDTLANKYREIKQAVMDKKETAVNNASARLQKLRAGINERVTQPAVNKAQEIRKTVVDGAKSAVLFTATTAKEVYGAGEARYEAAKAGIAGAYEAGKAAVVGGYKATEATVVGGYEAGKQAVVSTVEAGKQRVVEIKLAAEAKAHQWGTRLTDSVHAFGDGVKGEVQLRIAKADVAKHDLIARGKEAYSGAVGGVAERGLIFFQTLNSNAEAAKHSAEGHKDVSIERRTAVAEITGFKLRLPPGPVGK